MTPWREVLKVHPAAEQFPLLREVQPEVFEKLKNDISETGGLIECVKLVKSSLRYLVVDGRNRLDVLEALGDEWDVWSSIADGQEPRRDFFKVVDLPSNQDVEWFVISANIHRRHLTAEQKRELIARVLKLKPDVSNRQIAGMVDHDHKTVGSVRNEMEGRGELSPRQALTDTKGRKQPSRKPKPRKPKPRKPADDQSAPKALEPITPAPAEESPAAMVPVSEAVWGAVVPAAPDANEIVLSAPLSLDEEIESVVDAVDSLAAKLQAAGRLPELAGRLSERMGEWARGAVQPASHSEAAE